MFSKNFLRRTVSALFIVSIMLFATVSHAAIYTGEGSYIMNEGENLSVAKERAKADAMRNACEQAGVYVEGRTEVLNAQVTKDEIITMTSNIIKLVEDPKFHPLEQLDNLEGIMIRVTVKAEIDDADINKWLSKSDKEKSTLTSQMDALRKANEEQARQIEELKRQLAANPQDKDIIAQKFADEEKVFMSNQKVEEAWNFYDEEDYEGAVNLFNEALELNPNNPLAYYGRGTAYSDLKQYELAVKDLSKSIEIDPTDSYAYYNRGNAYYDLEQYEQAIQDYSKAIELDPEDCDPYYNRGNIYYDLEQYEQAIQDYSKAIELNPNDDKAYNNRGNAYRHLEQYEQAIEDLNVAAKINPDDTDVYVNRGNAYSDLGEYEKAIKDYSKAIKLDPDNANAYYNRGLSYREMGDEAKAQADFDKARELGYED